MAKGDLETLQTLETPDYIKGEISDDEMDFPTYMVPPNPDDSDILPSQVHPSYPYGNPTNPRHPAMKPRPLYDPMSKALFQDMGYDGGVTGALRWKDLALEELLPIDEAKEEAVRAELARKMASGSASNQYQPQPAIPAQPTLEPTDIEDNDEDEDEADENEDEDDESEEDAEED